MSYMDKSLTMIHKALINKEVTSKELIKESLEKAFKLQKTCNAFVSILEDAKEKEVTEDILSGIPYGIKDNYATKDILTTASSNTLNNYVPFYNATAIDNLNKHNVVGVAKTAMDEFGMGGVGITPHTGIVKNPWDVTRSPGGSSCGSAASVAAGVYPYALGSDTGDSIRKPAAYCGIVGYKPTYGMISRFGLFPFASSLDHCGVLTRNVYDAGVVVNAMKGLDENDMTSWDSKDIDLVKEIDNDIKDKKVCYIKEICDITFYPNASLELQEHLKNFKKTLDILKNLGVKVEEVSVSRELLSKIASVYVVISCAEATSNMSNLTGISFGPRSDEKKDVFKMMKEHRTKGFSPLIKRRFVIGSYVLQKENQERYFKNAARVRRLIVEAWKDLFKTYDAVILPVGSGPAPLIKDCIDHISNDENTILEEHLQVGNFGGFPSITIPNGFINNLPVGVNLTSNIYNDKVLLNIAHKLEEAMPYQNQIAKGGLK